MTCIELCPRKKSNHNLRTVQCLVSSQGDMCPSTLQLTKGWRVWPGTRSHVNDVLIGRAGASRGLYELNGPPSIYIVRAYVRPFALPPPPPPPPPPRANVKPTQSHPVNGERGQLDLYVLQPSLGSGIVTHDSDYPCPLPCQRSECSYRSLRR